MAHRITSKEAVVRCLYCGRVFVSIEELLGDQECQTSRLERIERRDVRNVKTSIACSRGFHARCFWNECDQCDCECHSEYVEEEEEEQATP